MEIKDLEIRKIPINMINPAEYNPRKDLQAEDEEYKKIKDSINEFGYIEPIVWNERTGNLVGGHQRFKILKSNDVKEVDVSVVNLDETKEKILNLALNKISGEWEQEKLNALLKELENEADLYISGFTNDEIDNILNDVNNINIDDFFSESANKKEKESKGETTVCPNCGHEFVPE